MSSEATYRGLAHLAAGSRKLSGCPASRASSTHARALLLPTTTLKFSTTKFSLDTLDAWTHPVL
jgi:hypothetical protein